MTAHIFKQWAWQQALAQNHSGEYNLEQYEGLNAVNENGETRLISAALEGDAAEVRVLLQDGADASLQQIYAGSSGRIRYAGRDALIAAMEGRDLDCTIAIGESLIQTWGRAGLNREVYYTRSVGTYTMLPVDKFPTTTRHIRKWLIRNGLDRSRRSQMAALAAMSVRRG